MGTRSMPIGWQFRMTGGRTECPIFAGPRRPARQIVVRSGAGDSPPAIVPCAVLRGQDGKLMRHSAQRFRNDPDTRFFRLLRHKNHVRFAVSSRMARTLVLFCCEQPHFQARIGNARRSSQGSGLGEFPGGAGGSPVCVAQPELSSPHETGEPHVHHQRISVVLGSLLWLLGAPGPSSAQAAPPTGSPQQEAAAAEKKVPPSPAKPASDEATAPRLVIETNAACALRIGGAPQPPDLLPGAPRTVVVAPGESLLECTSTTVPAATVKLAASAAAGAPQRVALDLAALVVKASCAGKPATLADLGAGVLRHCVTGTDWTQEDSGAGGLIWDDARAWCGKKGAGWELPSGDELAELIDRSGRSQTTCSKFTCNVSPRFKLRAPLMWTNQVTAPRMVLQVNLMLGGRHPTAADENHDYQALCVRRSTN